MVALIPFNYPCAGIPVGPLAECASPDVDVSWLHSVMPMMSSCWKLVLAGSREQNSQKRSSLGNLTNF